MSEMVELVARAIWDDACPGMEWGETDKLTYLGWARAAIEAMRAPTDAMIAAGELHLVRITHDGPLVPGLGESGAKSYQRMINRALK